MPSGVTKAAPVFVKDLTFYIEERQHDFDLGYAIFGHRDVRHVGPDEVRPRPGGHRVAISTSGPPGRTRGLGLAVAVLVQVNRILPFGQI